MGSRHGDEMLGAFQTDRIMASLGERLEVAPRPATEVEDSKGRLALDALQQGFNVLAHVVMARAFPELFGTLIVVLQRKDADFVKVLWIQFHRRPYHRRFNLTGASNAALIWGPVPAPVSIWRDSAEGRSETI